jgi:chromosome segregation ATPase
MSSIFQLEEARTETNQALQKLSKVEHELQETKQKYREQEEELQRKSSAFLFLTSINPC